VHFGSHISMSAQRFIALAAAAGRQITELSFIPINNA
jgi:hypothetical protein